MTSSQSTVMSLSSGMLTAPTAAYAVRIPSLDRRDALLARRTPSRAPTPVLASADTGARDATPRVLDA